MKRTRIKLPDEVDARLRHEAERRGTTVSALPPDTIEAYLGVAPQRVLGGGRTWRSGRSDIAARIEEILRQELAP